MSLFEMLFGTTTQHDYHIELPGGTYEVTTEVDHNHKDWPHYVAQKIRSVVSDDDLNTLRSGGAIIASVVSVGAVAYTLPATLSNKAAIRRTEKMVMELLARR